MYSNQQLEDKMNINTINATLTKIKHLDKSRAKDVQILHADNYTTQKLHQRPNSLKTERFNTAKMSILLL